MAELTLLDCTLRDGGYVNQWHFGRDAISGICTKLTEAKIDIIEVGFLTNRGHTVDDSLYSNCMEIAPFIQPNDTSDTLVAAMIAIGEMGMDPAVLPPADKTALDIVRITFHNSNEDRDTAFRYAACLMEKGYLVCMQPVGTTSYSDEVLLALIERINQLAPYAFYLVDTLGLLDRKELLRFIRLIDTHLASDIRLGFHSHNNLQLSYANAQCISEYDSERRFIVDCSIFGMGRGAGNLCTELIAQYLNSTKNTQYVLTPLYDALDMYVYPCFLRSGWGYNEHYFISAVHGCHPNYSAFLMNKQTLTMNEVDIILRNIPAEERYEFHRPLIEKLYYQFQDHNIDDTHVLEELKQKLEGKSVLLLAPGRSVGLYKTRIKRFIRTNSPVIIAINAQAGGIDSDYLFVSNLKRFYMLDTDSVRAKLILTSNLPHIVQHALYVDYSALCDQENGEPDNSGVMLLRLMKEVGVQRILLAGYDGFSKDYHANYFDDRLINHVDQQDIERKNTLIRRQIEALSEEMHITSLTPSKYFEKTKANKGGLIAFDLDGTLADTSHGILACHRYANSAMGRPIVDESLLKGVIGEPLLRTYRERFGYTEDEARKAVQIYRERYAQVGMEGTILYPGVEECLTKLKNAGYLLAVVTLKEECLAKNLLKELGIDIYFDLIVGMDVQDERSKANMLRMCMDMLCVAGSQTTLVGDSENDQKSAKAAGVGFVGVTYGFGFADTQGGSMSENVPVVDNSQQLAQWFLM